MKRCILFSFVSFISCSMLLKGGWEIKHSDELSGDFQVFNHLKVSTNDTGFLFGTQSSEEIFMTNQFENQNAIVWRTVDGGDSWSGKELCKGEIFTAFQSEDALYCVSKRSSKEAYALVDTSKIFASYDWGESWVELASFSRYYVRHVGFFNRDSGMALVYDQREKIRTWRGLLTTNGGEAWDEIFQDDDIQSPVFIGNALWYVKNITDVFDKKREARYVVRRRNSSGVMTRECVLPVGFRFRCFAVGEDQEFFIGGTQNDKSIFYKVDSLDNYRVIKEFGKEKFPYMINANGNHITLLTGERGGFGVSHSFYFSRDGGKSWKRNDPPITEIVKPIAFYKNDIWAYGGMGVIQIRKEKSD